VTATLPPEVREVFERFITCEYTTIDARQQPIVWPVTPYYSSGAPTLDTTTGLGYPKKANDARRNPRVALLFSDPTGSGIASGIQVLVQGAAEVDDRDLKANRKRYERESALKLPGARGVRIPRFLHGVFGWYVNRIYIKVRPERVFVWPAGELTQPPQIHDSHLEEVRSGHVEEEEAGPPEPEGGPLRWDERIDELGARYPSAVLSLVSPDGFPFSVRAVTLKEKEADGRRLGGQARARRGGDEPQTRVELDECLSRGGLVGHALGELDERMWRRSPGEHSQPGLSRIGLGQEHRRGARGCREPAEGKRECRRSRAAGEPAYRHERSTKLVERESPGVRCVASRCPRQPDASGYGCGCHALTTHPW